MPHLYIVEQSALSVGGHYYAYTRTVASAAIELGLDVTILENKRFVGSWDLPKANVVPAFAHTWGEAERLWITEWRAGNIAFDYSNAIRGRPPVAGDHVFFATLGYAELVALLKYLAKIPPGRRLPFFHVLLRYDPEILRNELGAYKPLFDKIAASPMLRRCVRFHADTDGLRDAFSRLTRLEFTTLPIPFDQEPLLEALQSHSRSKRHVVMTYLGDARLEKRFSDLVGAVTFLWKDYISTRKARFVLQANFNVAGGEPGILQAVQQLKQFPPGAVDLIESPMSNAKYYQTLAECDIVVIPYDPARYKLRSSGVLVEAMAAGKPIVTTSGSWMSGQVTSDHAVVYERPQDLGIALRMAIDQFPSLDEAAKLLAPVSLTRSSGRHFVESMLASVAESQSVAHSDAPRVLVIVDGDTLVIRNGAGQTALTQFRYLNRAGYKVVGLFIMKKRNLSADALEDWIEKLHDRIAGIDLDGAFIIGNGGLGFDVDLQKSLRQAHEHSIDSDVAEAAGFDVNLSLVHYLGTHKIDVVWLNYVTNMPLVDMLGLRSAKIIGETHDIQSFQKAIYANKRVDANDLKAEVVLLSQCDHLISVSSVETAYLSACVPNMPVTTTGMFLELADDPLHALAGLKNLGEVVSACVPTTETLRWDEAWKRGTPHEVLRLADLGSLDLLFVSSNHLANVSGLQWFLDDVFFPILAERNVSVFIVGSIVEARHWPEHKNLFYIGRVAHLAPLYAAARLVIIPVTEGAGVAVKTFEALSHGAPIVATSEALRGIEHAVDGVAVAQSPHAFATAILRLLAAEPMRKAMAKAARDTARSFFSPQRYAQLIDATLQGLLGERALGTPPSVFSSPQQDNVCEWNQSIVCVNRIVRSWIEGEDIEESSIVRASQFPHENIIAILDASIQALFQDKSCYLCVDRVHVMSALAHLSEIEHLAIRQVVAELVQAFGKSRDTRSGDGPAFIVGNKLKTWVLRVADGAAGHAEVTHQTFPLDPSSAHPTVFELELPDHRLIQPRLQLVNLKSDENDGLWCASNCVVLSSLSKEKAKDDADLAGPYRFIPFTREAQRIQFSLPPLYGRPLAGHWLDFLVGGEVSMTVTINGGAPLTTHKMVEVSGALIQRFDVPLTSAATIQTQVVIVSPSPTLGESDIVLFERLLFGDMTPMNVAMLNRAIGERITQLGEFDDLSFSFSSIESELVDALVASSDDGVAMQRRHAIALRSLLNDVPPGERALSLDQLFRKAGRIEEASVSDQLAYILGLFEPNGLDRAFVASWRLSLDIEIEGDTTALDNRPSLDDREMIYVGTTQSGVVWKRERHQDDQGSGWYHCLHVSPAETDADVPLVEVVARFSHDSAPARGNQLDFDNVYPPETSDSASWAWTKGSGPCSMRAPIALTSSGIIKLTLMSPGDNDPAVDIRLELNGSFLDNTVSYGEQGTTICAHFDADAYRLATTELVVWVKEAFQVEGDSRDLGVAISSVEIRLPLDR